METVVAELSALAIDRIQLECIWCVVRLQGCHCPSVQAILGRATIAIMGSGLPKLQMQSSAHDDDVTVRIHALGRFARHLARWLKIFASNMHASRDTDEYRNDAENSAIARAARGMRLINNKGKGKGTDKGTGKGKGKRI